MNIENDLVGAAMAYARRGWPVLPLYSVIEGKCSCGDLNCKSPGKHPRLEGWTKKATTNEAQIRAWFTQWPNSNVAILLGKASGLVAVDVDGKAGMDWIESIDPTGAIIASSGKEFHRHYIFRTPDTPIKTRIRLRTEVDFLAENRFLVVAPSRHHSGSTYEFLNLDGQAPGPLPAEVLAILNESAAKPKKSEPSGATIRAGNRNSTLTSLAGKMRRDGFSMEAILAALRETNKERCSPPLEEAEIEGIANSISNYDPAPSVKLELETETASSLLSREIPPIRWVVEGLLPEGQGVCAGPPKTGKSLLALQLGASCVHGKPFLGKFPVEQGRCLFLGLEDSKRRLKDRAELYLDTGDQKGLDLLEFSTEMPKCMDGGIALIERWLIQRRDARLIVIDTAARIRPAPKRNANMYLEDTAFLSPIQRLALAYRVCILLISHTRKALAKDPLNAISGSTGIPGVADHCWVLRRQDRSTPIATLDIIGRDMDNQTIKLTLNDSLRWEFVGIDETHGTTPERQAIISVLADSKVDMKTSEIAKIIGKSSSLTSHLLNKLLNEGQVVSPKFGHYTLLKKEGENHE